MQLYVESMVCNRCIMAVQQALQKPGIERCKVSLGEVQTHTNIP